MLKCLITMLTIISVSHSALAGCGSGLYSSISDNALNKSYDAFSTGSQSLKNIVETKALIRADKIFHKAGQLILNAKDTVYLQTWRFDHNSKPVKIYENYLNKLSQIMIKEKRKNPVHVWMMINVTDLQNMQKERKELAEFLNRLEISKQHIKVHIGIFNAKTLGASHTKSISVDHKSAVVMGANMSNNNNGIGFYDLGFVVHGEVVQAIDKDFSQVWNFYVDKDIRPVFHPIKNKKIGREAEKKCSPILYTRNKAYSRFTREFRKSSINSAMIMSVASSKKTIDILTPNLNSKIFINELKKAIKEKIKVRIILSKYFEGIKQELPTRGGSNIKNVERLYRSLGSLASRPYLCSRLQIKWYSEDGVTASKRAKAPNNHAKFMVVDNQVTYFGSANMDNQSWNNSREIGLFVDSKSKAKSWLDQVFDPVFKKGIPVQECGGPQERKPIENDR